MPIVVNCECGKQLRIPEQYAGKKVKCPSCGDPLLVAVPQKNGPSKKPVVPASKPAATPAVIKFECEECGRAMQARTEYAGRKAKCPGCQTLVTIPEPEEEAEAAEAVEEEESPRPHIQAGKSLPKKAASKRPVEEEEEIEEAEAAEEAEEEEEERPRKSKKKKSKRKQGASLGLLIGLGAAALLLLIGGAVGVYFVLASDSNGPLDDLAMIPADAQGFGVIRVAEVWKNPIVQELVPPVQQQAGKDFTKELQDSFGIDPGEIDRFVFVMQDPQNNKGWISIKSSKPIDKVKVTQKQELLSEQKKYQNKTYQISKDGKMVVHFAGDKMCVLAPSEDNLKTALDLATGARKADFGAMANAIGMAKQNPQTLIGFQIPPQAATQMGMMANNIPIPGLNLRPLLEMRNITMTLNLEGNKANVEVLLNYLNENKAKAAKTTLDTLKTNPVVLLMVANDPEAKKALDEMNVDVTASDLKFKSSQTIKPGEIGKMMAMIGAQGQANRVPGRPVNPGQPQNPGQPKGQPKQPQKKGQGVPR